MQQVVIKLLSDEHMNEEMSDSLCLQGAHRQHVGPIL